MELCSALFFLYNLQKAYRTKKKHKRPANPPSTEATMMLVMSLPPTALHLSVFIRLA
jgi:hypothetical protein